jgi:hypothetical protein
MVDTGTNPSLISYEYPKKLPTTYIYIPDMISFNEIQDDVLGCCSKYLVQDTFLYFFIKKNKKLKFQSIQ